MLELLTTNTQILWAGLVSAIVSAAVAALVTHSLRKHEVRHKLAVEYEFEQRKKLRDLIGRYHGRLVHWAFSLNQRLWNFYAHADDGWLNAQGRYTDPGYYLNSFAYRFLAVHCLVRQFESEAIYIDQRIAQKSDFTFLSCLTALGWVMTDVALFKGLPYDDNNQHDHFFGDNLRLYCDACFDDGTFLSPEAFHRKVRQDRALDPVFAYFDSVSRSEPRLRWDRLVAFHLILMLFLNAFGYKNQFTHRPKLTVVARQIRHPEVLANLVEWLPRLGLRGHRTRLLVKACETVRDERALSQAPPNPAVKLTSAADG